MNWIQIASMIVGAGLFLYAGKDKLVALVKGGQPATSVLAGVFQGELVNETAGPAERLREALRLITCHVACEIDDPLEQSDALNACRILKGHLPELPPARAPQVIEDQAAVIAAVNAYHATAKTMADKITAVG